MYRMRRGLGDPPQDDCPAGSSLFGNPPTCVTDEIAGQAAANIQAAQQGTCPPGFQLVGTGGQQFCSPMGASPTSPCDLGNVYLSGSCYPAGSTQSGGTITQPDGTQIDAATGMVIGSYDWTVAHGGGSTVSTGPAPAPTPVVSSAPPPAPVPAVVSSAPPAIPTPALVSSAPPAFSTPAIVSSAPPGGSFQVQTQSSGFNLSEIPWWGWAAAAAVALFAFSK
jgi:hypothetical protein